jgi:hypothetical protein
VLAHDLRLEGTIAVPRYLDHCFAEIAFKVFVLAPLRVFPLPRPAGSFLL